MYFGLVEGAGPAAQITSAKLELQQTSVQIEHVTGKSEIRSEPMT
jgi:hypothetical protein